jgi:hypothetical protein
LLEGALVYRIRGETPHGGQLKAANLDFHESPGSVSAAGRAGIAARWPAAPGRRSQIDQRHINYRHLFTNILR